MSESIVEYRRDLVTYQSALARIIMQCNDARLAGDIAAFVEAVEALYDTALPFVEKKLGEEKKRLEASLQEALQNLNGYISRIEDPIVKAQEYITRRNEIYKRYARTLFQKIVKELDRAGLLLAKRIIPAGGDWG